jgi:hypothetical protein
MGISSASNIARVVDEELLHHRQRRRCVIKLIMGSPPEMGNDDGDLQRVTGASDSCMIKSTSPSPVIKNTATHIKELAPTFHRANCDHVGRTIPTLNVGAPASAGSLGYVGSRRAAISPVKARLLQPTPKTGEIGPEESVDEGKVGKGEEASKRGGIGQARTLPCRWGRNGPQR